MNPIARNAILAAALVSLPGCAGKRALMPDDRGSLSSQPQIIAIHYPPEEDFTVRASFLEGPLGAVQAAYETARLKANARLEDPAPHVKDRLVNALQTNLKLTNVRTVSEWPQNLNIAFEALQETRRAGSALDVETNTRKFDSALKEAFQTGVVLEVQTRRWRVEGTRVVYSARAGMVRLSDLADIWRVACTRVSKVQPSDVPAFAEKTMPNIPQIPRQEELWMAEALKANDGALLRAKLREAADACADSLAGQVLRKFSQPDR